ncbi:lantibiotic dehydratase [Actinacidiphila acididurans]|uniref:Lantibiotic dehydratase n=1 Tax=Actinacidiphila acididurans TaxID=2784346 RepID=A0ABS2TYR9_9ACTN|nr:lantibiotic dehydratase [Actinacidiphila acididurans]MBM9508488.1 lantibiotic dehydratase [Actinacidiphila acididurans]
MDTRAQRQNDARLRGDKTLTSHFNDHNEWALAPIMLLRHAGFPSSLLRHVADSSTAEAADAVLAHCDEALGIGQRLKAVLRAERVGTKGDIASGVGMLRPFPPRDLARLEQDLGPSAMATVKRYQDAVLTLDSAWVAFEKDHAAALARGRETVLRLFRDPALQQVLLLSNDARFEEFAGWIDGGGGGSDGHVRRMTDLLTMYLQRVTTKNETHSHFGPLAVARVAPDTAGISWSTGPLRRVAFLSHWAGEAMAEAFSGRPELFETVRPRRRPLAFGQDSRIRRYAFETRTGMPDDWRFTEVTADTFDDDQSWLWERCDGEHTVAQLRADWMRRGSTSPGRTFDEVLRELVAKDWLTARWEIPVGAADPLRTLSGHLEEGAEGAAELAVVRWFADTLRRFADGPVEDRAALLGRLKETFEEVTGTAANRSQGLHYSDRSVLYEEAYSPVRNMTLGEDLGNVISRELSVVYDLTLLAPRLRVRREQEILRRWTEDRFGLGNPVALQHFYAGFFEDKPQLARLCEEVDRDIAALDQEITDVLLAGTTGDQHETVVDRDRLEELLARHPATPPALCNPDVMLAARDADALADGDFLAVVGDCHAVREALTHSSFAPMMQAQAPDLLDEVYARYQSLLDEDEVLIDLSRAHPDKTAAQLTYPCPDLEVHGLSPKSRDTVLQPDRLYLVATAERLELRAQGVEGRLKLLAPLAGGPSIRQDPLSPFAFPRHFGGVGIRSVGLDHLPRIRCGRIVLHRERWRIPANALRGWSPGTRPAKGDAAEFAAAGKLRRDLGLPRHGFLKIPGEPKPVYVDWESPLVVRQIFRLSRKSDSPLEFSEMLPSPEELWLDIDGERHTSELRCAVFSRGSH